MSRLSLCAAAAICLAVMTGGSLPAAAMPLEEGHGAVGSCRLMVEKGDQFTLIDLPGFDPALVSGPLTRPDAAEKAKAVICQRATIVPLPNDYRVLSEMNLPLALRAGERVLWLMIESGQLEVQFREGQASPEEMQALQARLNEMQTALQARH